MWVCTCLCIHEAYMKSHYEMSNYEKALSINSLPFLFWEHPLHVLCIAYIQKLAKQDSEQTGCIKRLLTDSTKFIRWTQREYTAYLLCFLKNEKCCRWWRWWCWLWELCSTAVGHRQVRSRSFMTRTISSKREMHLISQSTLLTFYF